MDGAAPSFEERSEFDAFAEKVALGDEVVLAVLRPLIKPCYDEACLQGDPEHVLSLIRVACEVVAEIRFALTKGPPISGQRWPLWRHDPYFPKDGAWAPAQEAVEEAEWRQTEG